MVSLAKLFRIRPKISKKYKNMRLKIFRSPINMEILMKHQTDTPMFAEKNEKKIQKNCM
jgi:hypothetical protein